MDSYFSMSRPTILPAEADRPRRQREHVKTQTDSHTHKHPHVRSIGATLLPKIIWPSDGIMQHIIVCIVCVRVCLLCLTLGMLMYQCVNWAMRHSAGRFLILRRTGWFAKSNHTILGGSIEYIVPVETAFFAGTKTMTHSIAQTNNVYYARVGDSCINNLVHICMLFVCVLCVFDGVHQNLAHVLVNRVRNNHRSRVTRASILYQ